MMRLIYLPSLALAVGCSSSNQNLNATTASDSLVLTESVYPAGSTLGQCVTYSDDGTPRLHQCPISLSKMVLRSPSSRTSVTPVDHKWGILKIDGGGGVPGYSGHGGFFAAYETVIYDTYLTEWKAAVMDETDFNTLSNFCMNQATSSPFAAIVTQEFDGCSLVRVEANAGARGLLWKIDAIAKTGHKIGSPTQFYAEQPESESPPSASCANAHVAVRVQVMGFGAFCKEVVAPEQIARLTRTAQAATTRVEEITGRLTAVQAEKSKAIADREQLQGARATDGERIAQLQATIKQKDEEIANLTATLKDITGALRSALGRIAVAGQAAATPESPSAPP